MFVKRGYDPLKGPCRRNGAAAVRRSGIRASAVLYHRTSKTAISNPLLNKNEQKQHGADRDAGKKQNAGGKKTSAPLPPFPGKGTGERTGKPSAEKRRGGAAERETAPRPAAGARLFFRGVYFCRGVKSTSVRKSTHIWICLSVRVCFLASGLGVITNSI